MTIIELNKRSYTIPTSWDELSKKQLVAAVSILYTDAEVSETLLNLFRIITNISWLRFFRTKAADMMDFFYLCYFLVNETGPIKNIITEYKGFYGPADDFNNLTGEEFIFCETQYFDFINSEYKNDKALNELVAILYRPGKTDYNFTMDPDGDKRQTFNQNISSFFADTRIKEWNRSVKLSIFHWYHACRERMISSNPKIFTGKKGQAPKYGLLSVMRSIAETGIHGNFNEVQKMQIKMWMMELNEKIAEAERMEKASK